MVIKSFTLIKKRLKATIKILDHRNSFAITVDSNSIRISQAKALENLRGAIAGCVVNNYDLKVFIALV